MRPFVFWTLGLAAACGAPKSEPIRGDLAAALERGIDEGSGTFDHSLWDAILSKYALEDGRRFDYAGLKKEEDELESYLQALSTAELERLSGPEINVLFINAYNAYTVRTILDRVSEDGAYEIASIREIDDVFTREVHRVGGFTLSLDQMEHNVLRPIFRDPRVHFAVNCASISCPPLPTDAFVGETLDEQLEQAARSVLGDPAYAAVEDDTLVLTKILEWYRDDFVHPEYHGSEKTLALFVARYASKDVRRWIEERGESAPVRFREYDWALNRP